MQLFCKLQSIFCTCCIFQHGIVLSQYVLIILVFSKEEAGFEAVGSIAT